MRKLLIFLFLILLVSACTKQEVGDVMKSIEPEPIIEYTPSTKTTCIDGTCTKSLYSGIHFVYEDNKWKDIKDARSLKNTGFSWKYLKTDSDYEIEIEDFNYTCLKKLKIKSQIGGNIPFKVNGVEYISPYMTPDEEIELEDICVDNILAYNFTFGFNSTLIKLQDANTENLDDAHMESNNADTNYHNNIEMELLAQSGRNYWLLIKFNLSAILSGSTILSADLFLNVQDNRLDHGAEGYDVATHHLFQYPTYDISGAEWVETTLTWNERPVGAEYNTTEMDSISFTGSTSEGWHDWDVLDAVKTDFDNGYSNVSIFVLTNDIVGSPGTTDELDIYSKEHSTTANRPYVNVNYELPPVTQTPTPTADLLNISQNNESIQLNASNGCDEKCLIYQDGVNVKNISAFPDNITGLINFTSYPFNFTVYNDTYTLKESNFSNTITTTTYQNVDMTPPQVTEITNKSVTNESAIISVTTNENANLTVNYGTTDSLGTFAYNATFQLGSNATLPSLTNFTFYYYNITSCDASENCQQNGTFGFTTDQNIPPSEEGSAVTTIISVIG